MTDFDLDNPDSSGFIIIIWTKHSFSVSIYLWFKI